VRRAVPPPLPRSIRDFRFGDDRARRIVPGLTRAGMRTPAGALGAAARERKVPGEVMPRDEEGRAATDRVPSEDGAVTRLPLEGGRPVARGAGGGRVRVPSEDGAVTRLPPEGGRPVARGVGGRVTLAGGRAVALPPVRATPAVAFLAVLGRAVLAGALVVDRGTIADRVVKPRSLVAGSAIRL
jgi:hypothetical protein